MKNAYYSYDITKVINIVLFIIHSFGNKIHLLLLNKLLYNADILHLSRYGYLLTRDKYMLMKNGLVPAHTYLLYTKLIEDNNWFTLQYNIHEFFFIKGNFIHCHQKYNNDILSNSEVSCLFETIRLCKNKGKDLLSKTLVYNISTSDALFNELSVLSIAKIIGVNSSMYNYILSCLHSSLFSEGNTIHPGPKDNKLSVLSAIKIGSVLKGHNADDMYIIVGASLRQYMVIKAFDSNKIFPGDFFEDMRQSFIQLQAPYAFLASAMLVNCTQLHIIPHDDLYKWMLTDTHKIVGHINTADMEVLFTALQASPTLPANIKEELVVYI